MAAGKRSASVLPECTRRHSLCHLLPLRNPQNASVSPGKAADALAFLESLVPAPVPLPLRGRDLLPLLRKCVPTADLSRCPTSARSSSVRRHASPPQQRSFALLPPVPDPRKQPRPEARGIPCQSRESRRSRKGSVCASAAPSLRSS